MTPEKRKTASADNGPNSAEDWKSFRKSRFVASETAIENIKLRKLGKIDFHKIYFSYFADTPR
jgi:hypothetical protein